MRRHTIALYAALLAGMPGCSEPTQQRPIEVDAETREVLAKINSVDPYGV